MGQGSRPDRVGEQIRQALSQLIARDLHDPGVGFVTLTRVAVSPDLQLARVYYTQMGDERQRRETTRALERARPFLRRALSQRVRLRRAPDLQFHFDESVENQERIERILLDLEAERQRNPLPVDDPPPAPDPGPESDET
ncbi:MAG TPA: 30S ribosome-binding factor RbfA [Vicinamibacterales bacterium]|nr:30S ribosome-binding factor RbfA [Vicinamibacterales bacterium]